MACTHQFNERKVENGKVNQRSTISQVKTENYPPPPSLRSSSPLSQGDSQYGVYPSQVVTNSPPETGGSTPQGGGGDKLSALSCRNEVCDPFSASVEYERKGNKNFAPFAPFA